MKILEASNGYILETEYHISDSENSEKIYRTEKELFEFEDEDDVTKALKRLLERIAEELGYGYDKWIKENINITFDKKGHKVE